MIISPQISLQIVSNMKKKSILSISAVIVALLFLSETKSAGQVLVNIEPQIISTYSEPFYWIVSPNKHTASYLRYRVTTIYSNALAALNDFDDHVCDIDAEYNLDQYKSISLRKIEKGCGALADTGGDLDWYTDCADWIFTQDRENPRLVSVTVSDIASNTAKARVVIDVFGNSDVMQHVDLWLVFENGDWFINDFQDDAMKELWGITLRDEMIDFFRSHYHS